jgi:membrane associated rhomboid family serine protease
MATCFHHQDRETGRACTRCGRPACPDCLIQAAVGSQCFECVRADRAKSTARIRQTIARDPLIATKTIIAFNVVMYVYLSLRDGTLDGGITSFRLALYGPAVDNGQWYRLVSYSVVHYGVVHILFNMLMLWLVGRLLEPAAGPTRFTTIYVVSVLGGAAGALVASPNEFTGGASGGVFGVAAAATLVMSRRGVRFWDTGFGPLLALNLVLGFFMAHISIGGHIGGLLAGALTAELMVRARKVEMPGLGYAGAAAVGLLSIAIAYAAAAPSG